MRVLLISVSVIALTIATSANATETVTYSYDAQGRLVQSVISGTVNNGQISVTTFDAAGNRTNYAVSTNGTPPPVPPPPPPASNQPPVTVADTLSVPKCTTRTKDVTANDSDPEGNLPLVLLTVANTTPTRGTPSVLNASTIQYEAGANPGSDSVTYTVQDSLGAASTGTLAVTVTNSGTACTSLQAPAPAGGGN